MHRRLDHPEYIFEKQYKYARDAHVEDDIIVSLPVTQLNISPWTTACNNSRLMNHLLSLFWTWDNSVERLMYRPLFEHDLASMDPYASDPRKRRFCTPFLVNALLALSCVSE
jgi:hypothetical protein